MKPLQTCLQLDVGNSSAKWRLMHGLEIVSRGRYDPQTGVGEGEFLACSDGPEQIWISSVASQQRNAALAATLEAQWPLAQPWWAETAARTGDLRNSYAEPGRMGVDRWLAMLAARQRLGGRIAVVDAGSALTVDIVARSGQHEGGYIIPGPQLMERALLLDTDRVRFDGEVEYGLAPGQSTAEAVRHGIAAAQAGPVKLILENAGLKLSSTVFCGGGAAVLMALLAADQNLVPDLVFEGLEILAIAERRDGS